MGHIAMNANFSCSPKSQTKWSACLSVLILFEKTLLEESAPFNVSDQPELRENVGECQVLSEAWDKGQKAYQAKQQCLQRHEVMALHKGRPLQSHFSGHLISAQQRRLALT